MNRWLCLGALGLSLGAPSEEPRAGNTAWRVALDAFCRANLQHPVWGLAHCERNYAMALALAREEGLEADPDVLYAAVFLHDIGALDSFAREGMDHGGRSAEAAGPILERAGFPMEKWPRVEEAIRGHMFYAKPGNSPEATLLRDADALDLLGSIGITRVLALTGKHRWARDVKSAIDTIESFCDEISERIVTRSGKKIAQVRREEMKKFLAALNAQTNGRRSLE